MSQSDSDHRSLRVVDDLGHELVTLTEDLRHKLIQWIGMEEAAGESSPGLNELRRLLLADEQADQ